MLYTLKKESLDEREYSLVTVLQRKVLETHRQIKSNRSTPGLSVIEQGLYFAAP